MSVLNTTLLPTQETTLVLTPGSSIQLNHSAPLQAFEQDGSEEYVLVYESWVSAGSVLLHVTNASWKFRNPGVLPTDVSVEATGGGAVDNAAVNAAILEDPAATRAAIGFGNEAVNLAISAAPEATRAALGLATPLNLITGCPYNTLSFYTDYQMYQINTDTGFIALEVADSTCENVEKIVFEEDTSNAYGGYFNAYHDSTMMMPLTIYYPVGATWADFLNELETMYSESSWVSSYLKFSIVGTTGVSGAIFPQEVYKAPVGYTYPAFASLGGNKVGDFAPLNGAVWDGSSWKMPVRRQPSTSVDMGGYLKHHATPNEITTLVVNAGTWSAAGLTSAQCCIITFPWSVIAPLAGHHTHLSLCGIFEGGYFYINNDTEQLAWISLPQNPLVSLEYEIVSFNGYLSSMTVSLNN